MRLRGLVLLLAAGLAIAGCGQDEKAASTPAPTGSASAPATATGAVPAPARPPGPGDPGKGRQVWLAQCIACHNPDPAKDGPVGPAVKGSSEALVEARVVHATYPPGYKPKRESRVMPPRPDLASSVPDLSAYLR